MMTQEKWTLGNGPHVPYMVVGVPLLLGLIGMLLSTGSIVTATMALTFGLVAGGLPALLLLFASRLQGDSEGSEEPAPALPQDFIPRNHPLPADMTTGVAARFLWIDPLPQKEGA